MTESEAIKELRNIRPKGGIIPQKRAEAIDIAIKALNKQIPKSPTYDGDEYAPDGTFVWDEWLCPCCRSRFEVEYEEHDYCPNCGQHILWEERDEQ